MLKLNTQENLLKRPIKIGDVFEFQYVTICNGKTWLKEEKDYFKVVEIVEDEKELIICYFNVEENELEENLVKRIRFIKGRWMERRFGDFWNSIREKLTIKETI